MTNNIKAIIFDLDGTLYDRNAAQVQVAKLIMQRYPEIFSSFETERVVSAFLESDRLSYAEFEAGAGKLGEIIRSKRTKYFLEILGIKEDCADAITEMYVREYPMQNIPIAAAPFVVRELSARFPIAVISNGLPDVQYTKLDAIGVREVFSCILLSEEIGIRKPDPKIFQLAAGVLQIEPAQCLFVGDSYRDDIVGAKSAGMQACWYNPESSTHRETDTSADFIITNMRELASMLKSNTD